MTNSTVRADSEWEGEAIPTAALDDRLGFVGTSGSGKTYAAGTAVERLLAAGSRVVVVDPLGAWWGLRLKADGATPAFDLPIFGGDHGDLPLNEGAGKLIGETVAGMAESCIVDLSALPSKSAERRFMIAFLESMYRKANGSPFHVVFDEADLWAPQKSSEPKLQALMEQIVRRGRIKGFIPWLITQRPAVISKDVLSQVDGLAVLKLTASQDRKAIGDWVKAQADEGQWSAIDAALPTMQRGHGVVWLPGRGILDAATFPLKRTFDSSRTPVRGERLVSAELRPLNLDSLKSKLAAIEDEAKSNDPKTLKAEVARLRRDLAAAEKRIVAPPPTERIVANADEIAAARAEGQRVGISIGIARAQQALTALRVDDVEVGKVAPRPTSVPRAAKPAPIIVEGDVPAGCAKPLAALAQVYPAGLTEPQWALAAGYKRSGGTWGTYKSRLRGAGLIDHQGGRWFNTEAGPTAVGDVETPPKPGPDLVRWWAAKLPGVTRIAEALIDAYPDRLSKDELAARVEMSAAGGSFGTYLSRLAGPGLIDRDGGIVLRSEVMA